MCATTMPPAPPSRMTVCLWDLSVSIVYKGTDSAGSREMVVFQMSADPSFSVMEPAADGGDAASGVGESFDACSLVGWVEVVTEFMVA